MTGSKFAFIDDELGRIREARLYRSLVYGRISGQYITVGGRRLLNLCSNDYLAIRPTRIAASQMQSSSRLISGNAESYADLERALAESKSQQAALVYPTGYMANLGVLGTVAGRGDLVLSDQLNHTSIIQAIRLSGATAVIYRHNDADDLQKGLRREARRKFVVTEGIFSMDGDYARLKDVVDVAGREGAILILDDAHGDFVAGKGGRGTASHLGAEADIYTSSLSKALGSFGGYVSSQQSVVDLCVNRSKPFIFTSALPSVLVEHALSRLSRNLDGRRRMLARNVRRISKGLEQMGLVSGPQTHIIPVVTGSEEGAVGVSEHLARSGVFARPVRYPAVPKGGARIRISVTAGLKTEEIDSALAAFESAAARFRLAI